jgi:hypothetical protein
MNRRELAAAIYRTAHLMACSGPLATLSLCRTIGTMSTDSDDVREFWRRLSAFKLQKTTSAWLFK